MDRDQALQKWVEEEFEWDRTVDARHIGVSVHDGAVTLSGHVASFPERWAATRAARRVAGVRTIADEIRVHAGEDRRTDDTDIATRIAHVLDWNVNIPDGAVQARVADGHVTLTGTVEWDEQRRHVEKQVRHVGGVLDITNGIEIARKDTPANIERSIHRAFDRNSEVDGGRIDVAVDGHSVILRGEVASLHERDVAHRISWSAPGVQLVIDELRIA